MIETWKWVQKHACIDVVIVSWGAVSGYVTTVITSNTIYFLSPLFPCLNMIITGCAWNTLNSCSAVFPGCMWSSQMRAPDDRCVPKLRFLMHIKIPAKWKWNTKTEWASGVPSGQHPLSDLIFLSFLWGFNWSLGMFWGSCLTEVGKQLMCLSGSDLCKPSVCDYVVGAAIKQWLNFYHILSHIYI